MHALFQLLMIPVGAFFRRVWGGFLHPNSALKRVILAFLAINSMYLNIPDYTEFLITPFWLAGNLYTLIPPLCAVIIFFSFLNPLHSYSFSFATKPAWKCILVSGLSYGFYTLLAGQLWELHSPHTGGNIYSGSGFLVPLGYYLAWVLTKHNTVGCNPCGCIEKDASGNPTNCWIDGFGAYGEHWLGLLILGGPSISNLVSKLF